MKTLYPVFNIVLIAALLLGLQACDKKHDKKGRLLVQFANTSNGSISFAPMVRSDSFQVRTFQPDTIYFEDKPYTGELVKYNKLEVVLFEGYVKNGLLDSNWTFYYASGAKLTAGKYKNGMDIGLWQSWYGPDHLRVAKFYDDYGYMLWRVEYYDNGRVKNYENVAAPMFGNKERSFSYDRYGGPVSVYVQDSILVIKDGDKEERFSNVNHQFVRGAGTMDVAK